jgi:hypothetical protein
MELVMRVKTLGLIVASTLVLLLNGCGSSGGDDYYPPEPTETYLFMVDGNGNSVADVHYSCENSFGDFIGDFWTRYDGRFLFNPGENCTFDFIGFNGTPQDPIFIEDVAHVPASNIPYSCLGGDFGSTYSSGSFEYRMDDSCMFEF